MVDFLYKILQEDLFCLQQNQLQKKFLHPDPRPALTALQPKYDAFSGINFDIDPHELASPNGDHQFHPVVSQIRDLLYTNTLHLEFRILWRAFQGHPEMLSLELPGNLFAGDAEAKKWLRDLAEFRKEHKLDRTKEFDREKFNLDTMDRLVTDVVEHAQAKDPKISSLLIPKSPQA